MAGVTDKAVFNNENYAEVKTMLLSNDEASINLALTILEQCDWEESQVYILSIIKENFETVFKNSASSLASKCPELSAKISDLLADRATNISTLSFRKLFEVAVVRNREEEIEFMLNHFKDKLMKTLIGMGFDFLEFLDIEVKRKTT